MQNQVMAQDTERIVRPFREKTEVGDRDWRTGYLGKWATSAVLACRHEPTPDHLAVLNKGVRELLEQHAERDVVTIGTAM